MQEFSGILDTKVIVFVMFICNYSAPTGRIIIAWGNAPGAGVYDVKALKGRIKILNCPFTQGAALGFNKAPFQG